MTVINYIGANATGKSTRVSVLVEYLEQKFESEPVEFTYIKRSKKDGDKEITSTVATRFSNGWVIFGKKDKSGKWVGLDTGMCSSWDQRSAFISEMKKSGAEVVLLEGYFNNRSKIAGPETFHKAGADVVHILVSYYDKCEDFLERTNIRSGRLERTMEWAENAPGWKDNKGIINSQKYWEEQAEKDDTITRISINEKREFLVNAFFDSNYVYSADQTPKKEDSIFDEW